MWFYFFLTGRADGVFESSCVCNNSSITISVACTVVGGGATIWEGNAFRCNNAASGSSIVLRHSQYDAPEKPKDNCNNEAIIVNAIKVNGSDYTSQLNLFLLQNMLSVFDNKTVNCTGDYLMNTTTIGSLTLEISNGKLKSHVIFRI